MLRARTLLENSTTASLARCMATTLCTTPAGKTQRWIVKPLNLMLKTRC